MPTQHKNQCRWKSSSFQWHYHFVASTVVALKVGDHLLESFRHPSRIGMCCSMVRNCLCIRRQRSSPQQWFCIDSADGKSFWNCPMQEVTITSAHCHVWTLVWDHLDFELFGILIHARTCSVLSTWKMPKLICSFQARAFVILSLT